MNMKVSEAQVIAALQVFYNAPGIEDWVEETKEDMRDAIRAACENRYPSSYTPLDVGEEL